MKQRRIGMVSTRFSGKDGVSLETRKWVDVLTALGHTCFFFAGECDYPSDKSRIVAKAHFLHPEILAITETAFSVHHRPRNLTEKIQSIAAFLKEELYAFVNEWDIELLIIENALTIPLNISLGVALTELLIETGLAAIAHHHDFFWERQRLRGGCVWDYLDMSFPPHLPNLRHVVINSLAGEQLSLRNHTFGLVIPNVMDFENPPPPPDGYAATLRADLGLAAGEGLILQPTRIIARKGIEHAIELVGRLNENARLVISHSAGDEGDTYARHVREYAALLQVPVLFASARIAATRGELPAHEKIYSLADAYQSADVVTYPSALEGFGNAFLEAVYYRRPVVVNEYSVYNSDIKPRGFKVIEFDGFVTDETVAATRALLEHPEQAQEMVEHNYEVGLRYFSYSVLRRRLETVIAECFGE